MSSEKRTCNVGKCDKKGDAFLDPRTITLYVLLMVIDIIVIIVAVFTTSWLLLALLAGIPLLLLGILGEYNYVKIT